jgi:hypothetical protein
MQYNISSDRKEKQIKSATSSFVLSESAVHNRFIGCLPLEKSVKNEIIINNS